MGESSGLARFAGCGIASTRAFTMRLAVIGQRLGCKRRSCQLNDFPCLVPTRPPLLLAPCTLIAPLISYLTSSIRIKSNLLHSTSFGLFVPTIHHQFTHRFFVVLSLSYSALQWEQPSPHPSQKAPLSVCLSLSRFFYKVRLRFNKFIMRC
ncbi:hypothetical protein FVEG_14666 [Fusarium verticillioides 7600]|uniref:Uncharacterized protein n=1 Tax=Gibberella moniliformis (strain M3125 / FGSC 7600) TaxID=334819 RepID=W7LCY7_GIBM7|nr:hypothetical protein FVEG_14666 [Fusarium verticillioides 7600]XP_018742613.1 hypothetical protein FVEG_14666 [Fusarium verticillioides 7600]EWG36421.1 hypothetical protein FVEG_14666 [Fusarium verticillioides 7600]EWG36422.1 hypothetical protein FVEG_14666 [Fusarium verticillioides 7600]